MAQWEEYICKKCDTNFQINEFGIRCGMMDDFEGDLDVDEDECSERYIHNVQCPVCGGTEFIIAFMSHRMPKRLCAWRNERMDRLRSFDPLYREIGDYANITDYMDVV